MITDKKKRLIINADDFGAAEWINTGIAELFEKGAVTSTSLMAGAPAFGHAASLARDNPRIDVGAHLTLVENSPVLPPEKIPSLAGDSGLLPASAKEFFNKFVRGNIDLKHIRAELEAQMSLIRDSGITISHVDSHQHTHLIPRILDIIIELAEKFGVKLIRKGDEPLRLYPVRDLGVRRMIDQAALLALFRKSFERIDRFNRGRLNHFAGFHHGGRLGKKQLLNVLKTLRPGVTELMCHPGGAAPGGGGRYTQWNYRWETEAAALADNEVRVFMEKNEIQTISHRELL